ncbi:MAG TPA: PLP-dependent aminotransferase family protein [Gemmatimonadaceae bacterium]|nr:PLP-dependent aminotransferase family protein [Gemmatimonadaceae bacterium]
MKLHISLVGRRDLSTEIFRQIRDAILGGVLRPGEALPASREMARQLDVARMTVTVAYERLTSEGYTTSRRRAGTFVSEQVHAIARRGRAARSEGSLRPRRVWQAIQLGASQPEPPEFDFYPCSPDPALFPRRDWQRVVGRVLRTHPSALGVYGDHAGHPELREAIARRIAVSRGIPATADDVIVTNGTQQALDLLTRVLLDRWDRIAVEDPGYLSARRLFESSGLRVSGVRVDGEGIVVAAIPRRARAVYVTPSHQYPLGVAMSLPRRQALLAWAQHHGAAIIEDDYDSEYRFGGRPLDPLQALDVAGRVLYVGSFSKTLWPSLRLGFIVAPPSLRSAVHKAKAVSDWHTSSLDQLALARFIEEGSFAAHLRRMRAIYRERHERVSSILARDFADHLDVIPSATGLHVCALARRASVERIAAVAGRARAAGVACFPLAHFAVGRRRRSGLVIGYGSVATARIEEGLHRLRACFDAS